MPVENLPERLPEDARKVALDATDALMQHKHFFPRNGVLLMLISRVRDDVREALETEPERYPEHGSVLNTLDGLTSSELDKVAGAVGILLQERFTRVMDDPELSVRLRGFQADLNEQKAERAQLQATIAS